MKEECDVSISVLLFTDISVILLSKSGYIRRLGRRLRVFRHVQQLWRFFYLLDSYFNIECIYKVRFNSPHGQLQPVVWEKI